MTLFVDLEHLSTIPVDFRLVLDQSADSALASELKLCAPLVVEMRGYSISDGSYRFEGNIQGTQLLTCSRSLEPFEHPFTTDLVLEIVRDEKLRAQELDDEDEELFRLRIPVLQKSVSIDEAIRQLVVLQEPMNPVKDPEREFIWKEPETPMQEVSDPRWEKLKEWKQKLDSSNILPKE